MTSCAIVVVPKAVSAKKATVRKIVRICIVSPKFADFRLFGSDNQSSGHSLSMLFGDAYTDGHIGACSAALATKRWVGRCLGRWNFAIKKRRRAPVTPNGALARHLRSPIRNR